MTPNPAVNTELRLSCTFNVRFVEARPQRVDQSQRG